MNYKYLFNIGLLGDENVGKSSFLNMLKGLNIVDIRSTIGVDFCTHTIDMDNELIKFHIWDLSGNERFRTLIRVYVEKIVGVLIFIDLNNPETLDNIDEWTNMIKNTSHKVNIILVGNKNDLEIKISRDKINDLSQKIGASYVETSCINNKYDASELFFILSKEILYKIEDNDINIDHEGVRLIKNTVPYKRTCNIL